MSSNIEQNKHNKTDKDCCCEKVPPTRRPYGWDIPKEENKICPIHGPSEINKHNTGAPSRKDSKQANPKGKEEKVTVPVKTEGSRSMYFMFLTIIIAILGVAFATSYSLRSTPSKDVNSEFRQDIYAMVSNFPSQAMHLWPAIVSGFNQILNSDPTEPCVLLLIVDEEEGTSKTTGSCLVREVAQKASLHMGTGTLGPAFLEGKNLVSSDYGNVLEMLRETTEKHKALVIENLQDLPGSMAQSLHVLCDRYNPAVGKAIIMMTLKGQEKSRLPNENDSTYAQRILTGLWKNSVPADKLPALLARVTDSVINIAPEAILPPSCQY